MSTAANHTTRASHSSSVPAVEETSYLRCPEGRIGYDVAGAGSLVVLVPGMGDLRAGYRFLAPALRAAGYRVACTDLRGHGDSDTTFASYGDEETAGDVIALIGELGGPAVVVGNSMGAESAVLAAAQRPQAFLEDIRQFYRPRLWRRRTWRLGRRPVLLLERGSRSMSRRTRTRRTPATRIIT